jgi:hypothetical protein
MCQRVPNTLFISLLPWPACTVTPVTLPPAHGPTVQPYRPALQPAHLDEAPARVAALSQHPQDQRLHIRQPDGALLAAQLHGSRRLRQGGRQLKRTQRRDSTAARCGSVRGWRPQQAQALRQLASLAAGSGCCRNCDETRRPNTRSSRSHPLAVHIHKAGRRSLLFLLLAAAATPSEPIRVRFGIVWRPAPRLVQSLTSQEKYSLA